MFYDEKADYKALLPPVLRDVAEISVLAECINPQLERLNAIIKKQVANKRVSTSDLDGIARWEKILDITPHASDTLEKRRGAARAKLMTKPPINLGVFRRIIETFLGVPVDISMWFADKVKTWQELQGQSWGDTANYMWSDFYSKGNPYVIWVYYKGTEGIPDLTPLYDTIYSMIPANLVVNISYRYATWGEVKDKYQIWEGMRQKTWKELRL